MAEAATEKDETWYQIEVIVATRVDNLPTLESFPFQPGDISWHQGKSLTQFDLATGNPNLLENTEFINLPKDQRSLNNEARTLANNANYKVLVHQSWRQILKGDKSITWIDIKDRYDWAGQQQLKGSVGFSKGRYLHIFSELHLNQFPSVRSASSQRAKQKLLSSGQSLVPIVETRYSLIQRRKMRSKELHYLDHPKLVLLVKVIPFTPAEPIVETPSEDAPKLIDLTAPSNAG